MHRAFAKDVVVGLVYVGPRDDFGWNQAHAVAAKALKAVPGVKVVEEENVPETVAVAKSMESMINLDGANLIFATSFGYFDPFVVDMAKKYPDVQFRHAAPLWNKDKHPMNAGSYFGYLNQAHYVDGVAAGLSTTSNKIGFVAAKPIPSVLSNVNSVLLGARKTNPKAVVQVVFTGEWSMPVREAEATNALVDSGLRHHHLPRRQPEGGDRDRREARRQDLRPQRLARPRWRPRASSPAPSTSGRRSTRATPPTSPRASRCPTSHRRLRQRHGAEHAVRRRRQRSGAQGRRPRPSPT